MGMIRVMKIVLFTVCLLINRFPQAQVNDAFTDGNFSENPSWEGDTLWFQVNGAHQLQTSGIAADTVTLATRNDQVDDTEWNIWVKLSFNTSANNYGRLYLVSDQPALDRAVNGYFIQLGGASDSLCFMKQSGLVTDNLFCFPGHVTNQSTNTLRIKMVRDNAGQWDGWLDAQGGTAFVHQGSIHDQTFNSTRWFGILCRYTASNAAKFYVDDVYVGPEKRDTISPLVEQVTVTDSLHLSILYSEIMDSNTALNLSHYVTLNENIHPNAAIFDPDQPERLFLTFPTPFPEQTMDSLEINGIWDIAGNRLLDTVCPFARVEPHAWDILINEIMANPDPPVGLPGVEYVELFNVTPFPVNLEGWQLAYGSSRKIFPAATISSRGYLLVTADSALTPYGSVISLFTSASTLSNNGSRLTLSDPLGRIVHTVEYDLEWGNDSWKGEGGWSLEMKDVTNPCGCDENWDFSEDVSGGTPGRENAIMRDQPDILPPALLRSYLLDSVTLLLVFSESMDSTAFGFPGEWRVEPGNTCPISIDPVAPDYTRTRLVFPSPFARGTVYTLTSSSLPVDCAGNKPEEPLATQAAFPEMVERNELIFNEVLFDPSPFSSRFIELVNRSGRIIDLAHVGLLAAGSDSVFALSDVKPVSLETYLLFPFDYVAVCAREELVKAAYHVPFPNRFVTPASFPSMTNTRGQLALIRLHDAELIDRMDYCEEMHYPLLSSTEGVSLERMSLESPALDATNWHSASSQSGFATPGYQNSQWREGAVTEDRVDINPPVFSPDNDGHDDVTCITFTVEENGGQVSISIYSATGLAVRTLASNALIGATGSFIWDGTDDNRQRVAVGIYIVFLEYLHPEGKVERIKRAIVVAAST